MIQLIREAGILSMQPSSKSRACSVSFNLGHEPKQQKPALDSRFRAESGRRAKHASKACYCQEQTYTADAFGAAKPGGSKH